MNGTSVAISFITKIILWLFHKLGINILLLIALIIEIPCMYSYYNERMYEVQMYTNQTFQAISEPELVSASDLPVGVEDPNDDNYKVMIQIDNLYTRPSPLHPSLYAEDDDGGFYTMQPVDYYADIDSYDILPVRTYFPAGMRVTLPCYIDATSTEGKTLSFTSTDALYRNSAYHTNDKNTLTITFP